MRTSETNFNHRGRSGYCGSGKRLFRSTAYEVEIAISGEVGLKKALEEEYDLIILDLMLPNTDGFEICRHVRQAKNIPILMVSASGEEIDKIRGLGLGADDYVTKPFSVGELVARVKAHLARYDRLMTDNFERDKKTE